MLKCKKKLVHDFDFKGPAWQGEGDVGQRVEGEDCHQVQGLGQGEGGEGSAEDLITAHLYIYFSFIYFHMKYIFTFIFRQFYVKGVMTNN